MKEQDLKRSPFVNGNSSSETSNGGNNSMDKFEVASKNTDDVFVFMCKHVFCAKCCQDGNVCNLCEGKPRNISTRL